MTWKIIWGIVLFLYICIMLAAISIRTADGQAIPAVHYINAQTYSIWSDKGMALYRGLPSISITTHNGISGIHFVNYGQPTVLNLRPGEAIIISADPKIVPRIINPNK